MPLRRPLLAAAASLVLLVGCDSGAPPVAPTAPATVVDGDPGAALAAGGSVQRRLERAAEGLLYTSESDYPFEYFEAPARLDGPLTVAGFRAAAGVPADSLVEELSLDAFFARHIELVDPADPAAQALVPEYERLKAVIRRSVDDARVFRVGRILIRCYLVGTDGDGRVVGLTTFAVET